MIKAESQVLDYAKRSAIPDKWDGKETWIYAIVSVLKADGSSNYAIAVSHMGKTQIIKDFGNRSIITNITGIFPYEYTDKQPTTKRKRK